MSTLDLQAEIVRLLQQERNPNILEAIRMLLKREDAEEDELSAEDMLELDRRRAERMKGDVPSHSVEESLRLAREGFK